MFNPQDVRKDFPILQKKVHGKPLVYLDNAATSQKPNAVIDAISDYYRNHNANVHRGVHQLSDESTESWHKSRTTIAEFFGADDEELILVRNTTEAINGVAYGWGLDNLHEGDIILTTEMEHHSDLVVWQELCKRTGAALKFIPVLENGTLDLKTFTILHSQFPIKLIALTHISNTLGTVNPIEEIVKTLHKALNPKPLPLILVDGAQSASHLPINFHKLGVDFFTFSGHKMLGPMGIGGLLVKKELLNSEKFKPWLFGGGMIEAVYTDHAIFNENPIDRFTAGTPDVASAVGLAEACKYLADLGMQNVFEHSLELTNYAIQQLSKIPEVQIIGITENSSNFTNNLQLITHNSFRLGSIAFLYEGVHPHDAAQILDSEGVAVRSGHHCTMPLHTKLGLPGTIRASFQVYNTKEDVDALVRGLEKVEKMFFSDKSQGHSK